MHSETVARPGIVCILLRQSLVCPREVFCIIFTRFYTHFQYEHGYKLGAADGEKVYLNNHLIINLKYNRFDSEEIQEQTYRVVGFDVLPHSIDNLKGMYSIIMSN